MPTTEEIREKSLHELLYNESNGKRKPLSTDIKQGGMSDCYLLSNLIDLAKTKPDFIMNELITTEGQPEDTVEVNFYENGPVDIKYNVRERTVKLNFKANKNKKHAFKVTKEQAMYWKTKHNALWPTVVEIAYAKFSRVFDRREYSTVLNREIERVVGGSEQSTQVKVDATLREMNPKSDNYVSIELAKKWYDRSVGYGKELKHNINDPSFSALTHVHLTGEPAKTRCFLHSAIHPKIKPFITKYSTAALKLYEKIDGYIKSEHYVAATFYDSVIHESLADHKLLADLLSDPTCLQDMMQNDKFSRRFKNFVSSHFSKKRNMPLNERLSYETSIDLFTSSPKSERKKLLEEFIEHHSGKLSKKNVGIHGHHYYTVLRCMEQNGHKYIIIANPYGTTTKIDYAAKLQRMKKKGTLPKIVTTPQQIDNANGECAMELNDFYKKLASIDYAYNPEDKAYEALRDMFK